MKRLIINIIKEFEDTGLKTDMLYIDTLVKDALRNQEGIKINSQVVEVL